MTQLAFAELADDSDTRAAEMPRATAPIIVVGAGSVGRRHLRNLATLGAPAVALRTWRGQRDTPLDVPAVRTWRAAEQLRPRAAIIANPTSLHIESAIAAAEMGCHLLIEKPIGSALDRIDELRDSVDARGLHVVVGYQLRFHPTLQQVRASIAAGDIGEPVALRAHWGEHLPDWHPDEDHRRGYSARRDLGGGVVLTLSHVLDYARWLLGDVRAVSAVVAHVPALGVDVESVASISLAFASGALGTITLDYVERPARHTLSIVGTGGTIHWNALDGIAELTRAGEPIATRVGPPRGFERNTMFVDELRHFLDCVEGRTTPACTLDDGVRAAQLALAVLQSAEQGRTIHV